ncbi:choice-of-anchor I family protein [Parahaliea mediterranea]|uniref:Choice-of-anchor I family protein n=1 Tax=Parahaliea mediterranea TaxID=651086 RepID=A0A939DCS7_9GAMM|nr:choice-of-anchor I family protein [Parahaliea mediterranea]MBN7795669.1 choice-of-anchor I family protein [Parahaliea mediterranea]
MFKKLALAAALSATTLHTHAFFNDAGITLEQLGTYDATIGGGFDEGAAEIVAHDPATQRLFVINANDSTVDVLDMSDPAKLALLFKIDVADSLPDAGGVNSVAVSNGLVAVAVEHDDKQTDGWVAFFEGSDGQFINAVQAGALPDAVTFTADGNYALVANEGEPSDDYSVDPEGSVSIVWVGDGAASATVRHATFERFNNKPHWLRGVRISGPGASVAQDLEPEFIATSADSATAWVTLQENNALARIDIARAEVEALLPLGTKKHRRRGNGLDASNRDGGINIANWPVEGLYMPDGLASYSVWGRTFLVSANEGDAREYAFETEEENCPSGPQYEYDDGECIYIDEARVEDLELHPWLARYRGMNDLQAGENIGRLKVVTTDGVDRKGRHRTLYSYGARSISIWDSRGRRVYDSGDTMERKTAGLLPEFFNSTNDENGSFDSRSDDKGPEPEGVVVGEVSGAQYAFVGLERIGGIMIFNVSNPYNAYYVDYVNNRDFSIEDVEGDIESDSPSTVGDLGPEGLVFIPGDQSPTGEPLLVVGNEISGTTTVYAIVPTDSN